MRSKTGRNSLPLERNVDFPECPTEKISSSLFQQEQQNALTKRINSQGSTSISLRLKELKISRLSPLLMKAYPVPWSTECNHAQTSLCDELLTLSILSQMVFLRKIFFRFVTRRMKNEEWRIEPQTFRFCEPHKLHGERGLYEVHDTRPAYC